MHRRFDSLRCNCGNGRVAAWDLRTLIFVQLLRHKLSVDGKPVISVSVNHKTGNIVTLVDSLLSLYDVNGNCLTNLDLLGSQLPKSIYANTTAPSCAVATDCPEWMTDGIVAVTGHANGDVRIYGLDATLCTPANKNEDASADETDERKKNHHQQQRQPVNDWFYAKS